MNENSLNNKLNRVEDSLVMIKNNLHFSDDAIIEEVAESTNLARLTNIFIQEKEPQLKDGIWIQADSASHPYDAIKADKNIIVPNKWRHDFAKTNSISSSFIPGLRRKSLTIGDNTYICLGNSQGVVKYNHTTNTVTALPIATKDIYDMDTNGLDELYLIFTNKVEIYNIETNTSTTHVASHSYGQWRTCCYSAYNNSLYLLHGGKGGDYIRITIAQFDLNSKTLTTLQHYTPHSVSNGCSGTQHMFMHGTDLICLRAETNQYGRENHCFKIDTVTNTITNMSAEPLNNLICPQYHFYFDLNSDHYIVVCGPTQSLPTQVYKINNETLEYEDVTNIFLDADAANLVYVSAYDGGFYGFIGRNGTSSFKELICVPMNIITPVYDNNFIVIYQSPIDRTMKQTPLWSYSGLEGRLCQSFYNVYYYNKETGFDFTLPMYYGDGTKWIKFKN